MNLTEEGKAISIEEGLDILLQEGLASGGSFALWRKPRTSHLTFIQDFSQSPRRVALNLEEMPAGFIVHPFADQEDKKAFFIQADRYEKLSLDSPWSQEDLPNWMQGHREVVDGGELKKNISKLLAGKTQYSATPTTAELAKEHYLQLVERGIQTIAEGSLEKIVPARTKVIPVPEGFDLGRTLATLLSQYPYSFVNFFHIPQVGTWMGASPETLIKTEGDYFHTMSLAGTQPAQGFFPCAG